MEFARNGSTFAAARTFRLGHQAGVGLDVVPVTAGLAVSPDGTRRLVANLQNDSVSLIDLVVGNVAEQDLRPGRIDPNHRGQPGGSFPHSVIWTSSRHAYVPCERDREIISLTISGAKIQVVRRMPVRGQPVLLLVNRAGTRLYAALDTTDKIAVFDATRDALIETVDATAPQSVYANTKILGGANSNPLAPPRTSTRCS